MSIEKYSSDRNRLRERVYERDEHRCQHCGRHSRPRGSAELRIRHVVPRPRGGSDHPRNLLTLCRKCHDRIHEQHIIGSEDRITLDVVENASTPSSGTGRHAIAIVAGGVLLPLMATLLVLVL